MKFVYDRKIDNFIICNTAPENVRIDITTLSYGGLYPAKIFSKHMEPFFVQSAISVDIAVSEELLALGRQLRQQE